MKIGDCLDRILFVSEWVRWLRSKRAVRHAGTWQRRERHGEACILERAALLQPKKILAIAADSLGCEMSPLPGFVCTTENSHCAPSFSARRRLAFSCSRPMLPRAGCPWSEEGTRPANARQAQFRKVIERQQRPDVHIQEWNSQHPKQTPDTLSCFSRVSGLQLFSCC